MNQEQINELRQLAQAATPGPWRAAISSSMVNSVCTTFETVCETGKNIDDALYIAAANPAAILALIAEIDSLRDEVNGLTGELGRERERMIAYVRQCIDGLPECKTTIGQHMRMDVLNALAQVCDGWKADVKEAA